MGLLVENLTKTFGNKVAVDHLSFQMEEPGVFGLIGTNGAGKTTTIRMILGIMQADEGRALWNGTAINRDTLSFGYMPEERGIYMKNKVLEQFARIHITISIDIHRLAFLVIYTCHRLAFRYFHIEIFIEVDTCIYVCYPWIFHKRIHHRIHVDHSYLSVVCRITNIEYHVICLVIIDEAVVSISRNMQINIIKSVMKMIICVIYRQRCQRRQYQYEQ
ncbi:MAG: ATP-binding cassette domain-containing protein [Bacteroidales bacterium]|nr:ATP-binding cassette domain-containing protein [Bacteroidales bacterium]